MRQSRPVQITRKKPTSLETNIVTAIGSVGPRNVAQIARMVHAHEETVRYKIKKQFAGLGFRYQAEVDYRKLGLRLHWGSFIVSPVYYKSTSRFFEALNNHGYLIHYSKILPQGNFAALFSLPEGKGTEFEWFLERLRMHKIIMNFKLDEVRVEHHKLMDPTFFNFQKGGWEVDWKRVKAMPGTPLPLENERSEPLADETDMLIIKELQKDARQHIKGISRALRIDSKVLEYHYRTHIVGRKLMRGYRFMWGKDSTNTLAHSVIVSRMTFRGLRGDAFRKVQAAVSKIPFLWVEDLLRDGTYVATLSMPTEDFAGTIDYLNEEVPSLGPSIEMGFLKVGESHNFTIPYDAFSDGEWQFDPKEMEKAVLKELSLRIEK
jgi:DNA-binding Lrp family transcriptional regulator